MIRPLRITIIGVAVLVVLGLGGRALTALDAGSRATPTLAATLVANIGTALPTTRPSATSVPTIAVTATLTVTSTASSTSPATANIVATQTRTAELAQLATLSAPTPVAAPITSTPAPAPVDTTAHARFFAQGKRLLLDLPVVGDATGDGVPEYLYEVTPAYGCGAGRCFVQVVVFSGQTVLFDSSTEQVTYTNGSGVELLADGRGFRVREPFVAGPVVRTYRWDGARFGVPSREVLPALTPTPTPARGVTPPAVLPFPTPAAGSSAAQFKVRATEAVKQTQPYLDDLIRACSGGDADECSLAYSLDRLAYRFLSNRLDSVPYPAQCGTLLARVGSIVQAGFGELNNVEYVGGRINLTDVLRRARFAQSQLVYAVQFIDEQPVGCL